MDLARVEGTVVSTAKTESLHGYKLLVITLLNADTSPTENQIVAIDTVGSGWDEVVLVVRGSSARQAKGLETVPSDASIVAIVDTVVFRGKTVYEKLSEGETS